MNTIRLKLKEWKSHPVLAVMDAVFIALLIAYCLFVGLAWAVWLLVLAFFIVGVRAFMYFKEHKPRMALSVASSAIMVAGMVIQKLLTPADPADWGRMANFRTVITAVSLLAAVTLIGVSNTYPKDGGD